MRTLLFIALAFALSSCTTSACKCGANVTPSVGLNLDPSWKCASSESEVTCRERGRADRIVIWSMKHKGAKDSIDSYRAHLAGRINHDGYSSKPVSLKTVDINGDHWIDAVQSDSELPGYDTRYLATVDDQYATLVTFSAPHASFDEFSKEMQPVIDQLTVRR